MHKTVVICKQFPYTFNYMDIQIKNRLLSAAKEHIAMIRSVITDTLSDARIKAKETEERLHSGASADTALQAKILDNYLHRIDELQTLFPSPYFVKCELRFDGETTNRILYFAKFTLPEQSIFSWTAPGALLRFELPGRFSYGIPGYAQRTGELFSKEQYLISDGSIVFMSAESKDFPRELVYQDYFSQQKSSFLLPEIVEQMEQAQDKVIRAHYQGSFLISGPAGSGKTTLALHRVAYLLQSPDTAAKFNADHTIVFVQDDSTKAYFSQLLPQLGIHDVMITTFDAWAKKLLSIPEVPFVNRYGNSESEADLYEFAKYQALKSSEKAVYHSDIFLMLRRIYVNVLSDNLLKLFFEQRKAGVLDRFDLTLLIRAFLKNSSVGMTQTETVFKQMKNGKVKRSQVQKPFTYSLMILDEVQNYLPEQIQILRSCMDATNSMVYVGDLAQQTRLCTIREWSQVGERLGVERSVLLQKNYRSTSQILEYINSLGYQVTIPKGIKTGPTVQEYLISSDTEERTVIQNILKQHQDVTVGILAKTEQELLGYRKQLIGQKNVFILTINEAQGVEFEVVILIGISEQFFTTQFEDRELAIEKQRVNRDLLYVALTRPLSALHVLGTKKLSEIAINAQ